MGSTDEITKSKLSKTIAVIGLVGTICAAVISGAISYIVAKNTSETEVHKIESDSHIAKSQLFNSLMEDLESGKNDYALLALWKIYPDDHRLVLVSALQNPTKNTMNTLRAIAPRGELDEYQDSIESLMIYAKPEEREEFADLFIDVSPDSVLRVYIRLFADSIANGPFEHSKFVSELQSILEDRYSAQKALGKLLQDQSVIVDDLLLEGSASLSLIKVGYENSWNGFLNKLQNNHEYLREFVSRSSRHYGVLASQLYDSHDNRSQLETILLEFMGKACLGKSTHDRKVCVESSVFYDLLNDRTNKVNDKKFASIVNAHIKKNPGYLHLTHFELLFKYDLSIAENTYFYVLQCSKKAEDVYEFNNTEALGVSNWDHNQSFESARSNAISRIGNKGC